MTIELNEPPLITFVLLAFNHERFIREAVQGAFDQDYRPLQIILSDDKSVDGTFGIIEQMAAGYHGKHRILVNQNASNVGIGAHVSQVILKTKGEAIIAAAGDDVSHPNRTSVLVRHWLQLKKPAAMCSESTVVDSAGQLLGSRRTPVDPPHHSKSRMDCLLAFLRCRRHSLQGCSALWTPGLFSVFGEIPSDVLSEDKVLSLRAWLTTGVHFVNHHLVDYRVHENNVYHSTGSRRWTYGRWLRTERRSIRLNQNSYAVWRSHAEDLGRAVIRRLIDQATARYATRICEAEMCRHRIKANWHVLPISELCSAYSLAVNGQRRLKFISWLSKRIVFRMTVSNLATKFDR